VFHDLTRIWSESSRIAPISGSSRWGSGMLDRTGVHASHPSKATKEKHRDFSVARRNSRGNYLS